MYLMGLSQHLFWRKGWYLGLSYLSYWIFYMASRCLCCDGIQQSSPAQQFSLIKKMVAEIFKTNLYMGVNSNYEFKPMYRN